MVSIQPEPQDNTRVNQQKNLDLTKMGGSKEVIKIVPPGKQIYGEQIHMMNQDPKKAEEDLKKLLEQRKIETHNKAQETKGKQKPSHGI